MLAAHISHELCRVTKVEYGIGEARRSHPIINRGAAAGEIMTPVNTPAKPNTGTAEIQQWKFRANCGMCAAADQAALYFGRGLSVEN